MFEKEKLKQTEISKQMSTFFIIELVFPKVKCCWKTLKIRRMHFYITNKSIFWEARKKANPPDQMKEMKKMLEKMMMDIAQLKEQQNLMRKN